MAKDKVEIPLDENAVYAVVNGEVFIIPNHQKDSENKL